MTPKEKAKELFLKFAMYIRAGYMFDEEADEDAKQCALIAVDEILEATKHELMACSADGTEDILVSIQYDDFWQEVKQEIEKL